MTDETLHLFEIDGADTVVARDADDAWSAWSEFTGGFTREDADGQIKQLPDDKVIAIRLDDTPGAAVERKTCAEWARENGRGFLCSTEY